MITTKTSKNKVEDSNDASDSFDIEEVRSKYKKISSRSFAKRIAEVNSPIIGEVEKFQRKSLIKFNAKALISKFQNFTGLHRICFIAKGESDPLWEVGLKFLQNKATKERKEATQLEQNGMIPLFIACQRQPPVSIVKELIDANPGSLYFKNNIGITCLHSACKFNANEDVIRLLVERHRNRIETVEEVTDRNENAMLLWMYANGDRPPSISIFKLLLTQSVITQDDEQQCCPLDFICYYSHRCDISQKHQKERREHCIQIFDAYLDARPYGTSTFLKEASNFPPWLKNHLSQHVNMRHILNFRISQKLTTAVFMLDFYAHLLILVSFTEIVTLKKTGEDIKIWNLCLIVCIVYLSCREALQFISASLLDYIADVWNWIDVIHIVLLSICVYGFQTNNVFDIIASATGFMIWITMASFLRAAYLQFSVMVMGLIHVTKVLLPFLVILFCLLSSFALLTFTSSIAPFDDNITTCADKDAHEDYKYPFCTFGEALFTSITLFIGAEEYDNFGRIEKNRFRVIVFLSLSAIIVLNVIIAIVNDSFGSVSDEAERVFWLNRLYFVSEIEGVRNFFVEDSFMSDYYDNKKKESSRRLHISGKYDEMVYMEYAEEGRIIESVHNERLLFDILVSAITTYHESKDRTKKENIFKILNHGNFRWIVETKLIVRRLIAVFVLPCWVLAGFFCAGWYWPPQIRELLLCSGLKKNFDTAIAKSKKNENELVHKELSNNEQRFRIQVLEEDNRKMMNEIRQMKSAINDMRGEYVDLKEDFKDTKKEMIDEMKLVRSVLLRVNMKLNMFD